MTTPLNHNPRRGILTYRKDHPLITLATTSELVFFAAHGQVFYVERAYVGAPWTYLCDTKDIVLFEETDRG